MQYHIIIAEDNTDIAVFMETALTYKFPKINITLTSNGQDALAVYRQKGADLLIMDYHMPKMSGTDALRSLRAQSDTVPCVLVSAFPIANIGYDIDTDKATISLAKPVDIDDLYEAVEHMMRLSLREQIVNA